MSDKNPLRVAAGRLNRKKRGPLTEEGLSRLREATLQHRPWEKSTGPTTAEGKSRSAANGRTRQSGLKSRRQIRNEVASDTHLLAELAKIRKDIEQLAKADQPGTTS
jgi:hypothetical protein